MFRDLKNAKPLSSVESPHSADSVKLVSQKRIYFFQFTTQTVQDLNKMQNKNIFTFAQNEMIFCDISLGLKGV